MDLSVRFLFMALGFTPVAVTLGLLRPFWGLCMLCFLYFFRPGIWGAPDWFRPWNWITLAVSIGWLLNAKTIRFGPIMGCALLFLLAYLYAAQYAVVSPETSKQTVITLAKLMWVMWLTLQLVDTRDRVRAFFYANLFGMMWNIKTVMFEGISSGGQARVDVGIGQGGGANYIALIVNIFLPFLLINAMYSQGRQRKFARIMIPFWLLSLVFTGSRSGLLGLGVIFLYVLMRSKHKVQGLIACFFMGLLVLLVLPSSEKERFAAGFKGGEERDGSAQERVHVWGAALEMFQESPVHGIGPDNFQYLSFAYVGFHANKQRGDLSDGKRQGYVTHNTWLQTLAEGGALAIIPYVSLFILAFAAMRSVRRADLPPDQKHHYFVMSCSMEGLFLAFMVSSTFGSQLKNDALWWFLALAACIKLNNKADQRFLIEQETQRKREERKRKQKERIADRAQRKSPEGLPVGP